MGLQFFENYGNPFVADILCNNTRLALMFLLLNFSLLLVLGFVLLIIYKERGVLNIPWTFICIPLWVLHLIVVFGFFVSYHYRIAIFKANIEKDMESDTNPEAHLSSLPLFKRHEGIRLAIRILKVCLLLTFEVFFVLRTDEFVGVGYSYIWIPYFIVEFVILLDKLIDYNECMNEFHTIATQAFNVPSGISRVYAWFEIFKVPIFRVAFAVLVYMKFIHYGTYNWLTAFTPFLAGVIVIPVVDVLWDFIRLSRSKSESDGSVLKQLLVFKIVMYFILGGLLLSFIGMFVAYTDNPSSISLHLVFIPVFIVLSLLLCLCGCCFPCLTFTSASDEFDVAELGAIKRYMDKDAMTRKAIANTEFVEVVSRSQSERKKPVVPRKPTFSNESLDKSTDNLMKKKPVVPPRDF
jgi:hypothetical protein